MSRSLYASVIGEYATALGQPHANVRHIEAYIRLEHDTLDTLTTGQLQHEVLVALECIASSGHENAEALAQSMGL